jgi:hypothetical protein
MTEHYHNSRNRQGLTSSRYLVVIATLVLLAAIVLAILHKSGNRAVRAKIQSERYPATLATVTDAGITPDGAVWVIARSWYNRTPDNKGRLFHGFRQIEDDLGREYRRIYASHELSTNRSMDVFVPLDYPFDERTPQKITLTCKSEDHPHIKHNIIGTIELTRWRQGELWPEGTIPSNEQQLAITLARRHCNAKRYDKAERILSTIPGKPEESPAALAREQIRSRIQAERSKRKLP